MTENIEAQTETLTKRIVNNKWSEYRLLFYSALMGVVGGLGAQLFVWLLNFTDRLLLLGIAGYQSPEPGVLNPQPIIGNRGLWLIPAGNNPRRTSLRNIGLHLCARGRRSWHRRRGGSISLQRR